MDLRSQHRDALDATTRYVLRTTSEDLDRPTPCAEWTLGDLLAHMIGQHHGFAAAVREGNAPHAAYAPVSFTVEAWEASVSALLAAFGGANLSSTAVEVELAPTPLPIDRIVAAQFLDTVVHTWDVARSLSDPYTPGAEVAEIVARIADSVPDDERRERAGSAFAPALQHDGTTWERALARLGRDPHWSSATVGGAA
jgi:uncharacterized protein (TIGR03086 family)